MANFGPLSADFRFRSLGYPIKFQRVLRLGFVTAAMSFTGSQPNFARCLAISCAGTVYTFLGAFAPDRILPHAKFTLCPSLAFSYIGSVIAQHSSTRVSQTLRHGTRNGIVELSQRAPPIFGWAAITLGIVPHSSCLDLLWSPYVIGQTIIFLPCSFFLLLLLYFSSPNLSGRRLDVYRTLTHGVALVQI